jgi:hypothetical protein
VNTNNSDKLYYDLYDLLICYFTMFFSPEAPHIITMVRLPQTCKFRCVYVQYLNSYPKPQVSQAKCFEIFILSEREVYHEMCHIAISKIVRFRKDYPQTGEDMNF